MNHIRIFLRTVKDVSWGLTCVDGWPSDTGWLFYSLSQNLSTAFFLFPVNYGGHAYTGFFKQARDMISKVSELNPQLGT